MNLNSKVKRFREIANELADLYEKKNSNYGDSFGQLYKTLGPISGLVPLHNKLDRATNLIKGDTNHFESIEDTLRDLASYTIMNLIEMEASLCKKEDGEEEFHNAAKVTVDDFGDFWDEFKGVMYGKKLDDDEEVEYSNEH